MSNTTMPFQVDPSDLEEMQKIMDEYGASAAPFTGKNEDGDAVSITVYPDEIIMKTNQKNRWIRKNVYHRDGTSEETYAGKWR